MSTFNVTCIFLVSSGFSKRSLANPSASVPFFTDAFEYCSLWWDSFRGNFSHLVVVQAGLERKKGEKVLMYRIPALTAQQCVPWKPPVWVLRAGPLGPEPPSALSGLPPTPPPPPPPRRARGTVPSSATCLACAAKNSPLLSCSADDSIAYLPVWVPMISASRGVWQNLRE